MPETLGSSLKNLSYCLRLLSVQNLFIGVLYYAWCVVVIVVVVAPQRGDVVAAPVAAFVFGNPA